MNRKAAQGAQRGKESDGDARGRAHALGWYCFLAFVAVTPLVIGILPPQIGPLSLFSAFDPIGLPKVVTFLVLSGLSLAALCVSVARGESDLRWHPIMWILLGLVGWAGASTLLSPSPAVSILGHVHNWHGLMAFVGYGLVAFLAIQYVRSTRELRSVMIAAVICGALVSVYAVSQSLGVDAITWVGETSRVFSSHGNADMLGNYLLFPLALAVGLALTASRGRSSYAWWSVTGLIAVALILTTTMGAWVGAVVMIPSLAFAAGRGVWHPSRQQKLAFGGLAALVLAASAAAAAILRPDIIERLMGSSPLLVRLSNGRTVIWLTGLRGWMARPITGWGPDGFGHAFQSAVGPDWYAIVPTLHVVIDAHNFLIHTLVTLGIPGLVLTIWALGSAGVESFRALPSEKGSSRVLRSAPLAAFIGLATALFFGVSGTIVSVWLWLSLGLVLAPMSRRIEAPPKPALRVCAGIGVALAVWASSWFVADVAAGHATHLQVGRDQVSELRSATRINPLQQSYRWQAAEARLNEVIAERRAGGDEAAYNQGMLDVMSEYDAVSKADRDDVHIRVAHANLLVSWAAQHPGSAVGQRAIEVALDAVGLSPRNPAALAALARAYQVTGRADDAEKTARLARSIAPAYSMQTLGTLGLSGTSTP